LLECQDFLSVLSKNLDEKKKQNYFQIKITFKYI